MNVNEAMEDEARHGLVVDISAFVGLSRDIVIEERNEFVMGRLLKSLEVLANLILGQFSGGSSTGC